MTAIELVCRICKRPFWSSGFDRICYECACDQEPKVYERLKHGQENLQGKE